MENKNIKGYDVSVDLERGGSGRTNIHIKVNDTKYYFNRNLNMCIDKNGNPLPKSLRGNEEIIKAINKALKLANQGF